MDRKSCKTCVQKSNEIAKGSDDTKSSARSIAQYVDALNTGQKWNKYNLKYYFYKATDTGHVESETLRDWDEAQKANWRIALQSWDDVSALTLTETTNKAEADIKLILIDDNSYPYLGHAYFPGGSARGENYVSYNNAEDKDFTVGSYDYITLVHELGHTLGLAHPHDTGGTSGTFAGVGSWWHTGVNQQNQTVYTVMSYNDLNGPITPDNVQSYGFIKGPMAYDIKTIQTIYPGIVTNNTDSGTYVLPTTNEEGTAYESIFDTAGTDTISAVNATTSTKINLNAATVDGGKSGGGNISKVNGIDGGFTIAHGTKIENAIGGSGNDTIIGNSYANVLEGNAGADRISGGAGNDRLEGGSGNDRLTGGSGNDTIIGGSGNDVLIADAGNDRVEGGSGNDYIYAKKGSNTLIGGPGRDTAAFPGKRNNYSVFKYGSTYVFKGRGRYRRILPRTSLQQIEIIRFLGERNRRRKRVKLNRIRPNRIYVRRRGKWIRRR